mgnify:CR=1 FL=1
MQMAPQAALVPVVRQAPQDQMVILGVTVLMDLQALQVPPEVKAHKERPVRRAIRVPQVLMEIQEQMEMQVHLDPPENQERQDHRVDLEDQDPRETRETKANKAQVAQVGLLVTRAVKETKAPLALLETKDHLVDKVPLDQIRIIPGQMETLDQLVPQGPMVPQAGQVLKEVKESLVRMGQRDQRVTRDQLETVDRMDL